MVCRLVRMDFLLDFTIRTEFKKKIIELMKMNYIVDPLYRRENLKQVHIAWKTIKYNSM